MSQLQPCCFASQFVWLWILFVQMLSIDLSIRVSGLDFIDSAVMDGLECDSVNQREPSPDLISQWEAELLQERLQELLHTADHDTQVQRTKQFTCTLRHNTYIKRFHMTWADSVSSLGHWAAEESELLPPGQQRSGRKVFCRAPSHRLTAGQRIRRRGGEKRKMRILCNIILYLLSKISRGQIWSRLAR